MFTLLPFAISETSPLRQAIDQADTIELMYADRVISFEFAVLNYRAPRQSHYRYKLEGFDDWTEVGSTQRLVIYTELRIADVGQGFDPATTRRYSRLGLISIDERVRLVQGSVHIVPEPRRGTELRVRVPLHACESTPLEEEHAPRKSTVS